MRNPLLDAEVASRVFQMITEGRLKAARTLLDEELEARSPIPEELIEGVVKLYNSTGLPKVEKLTESRKRSLRVRCKEHPNLMWWHTYFNRVTKSPFLMGKKPGVSWRASFDWLIKPANMLKVIEGNYDSEPSARLRLDAQDEAAYRMSGNIG